jgi:DNA-binding NtrC family response regulator
MGRGGEGPFLTKMNSVEPPAPDQKETTILLVEDEVLIRVALCEFLQDCGFTVCEVSSAEEAVLILEEKQLRIDLVLTDVHLLGRMDGFDLARWIHGSGSGLPVLITTGDKQMSKAAKALCEVRNIIPKPHDYDLIHTRITETLSLRSAPCTPSAR